MTGPPFLTFAGHVLKCAVMSNECEKTGNDEWCAHSLPSMFSLQNAKHWIKYDKVCLLVDIYNSQRFRSATWNFMLFFLLLG